MSPPRPSSAGAHTLHLIDVENLAGGSGATAAQVVEALAGYRSALTVRAGDHVVIASGRALLEHGITGDSQRSSVASATCDARGGTVYRLIVRQAPTVSG